MPITIGVGSASAVLDDNLARAVEQALDQAVPTLRKTLEAEVDRLEAGAEKAWPVGPEHTKGKLKGRAHSRDLFAKGLRLPDLDTVEAWISNSAPYVYLIRAKKLGGRAPWKQLVQDPVERSGQRIADELAEQLSRLL